MSGARSEPVAPPKRKARSLELDGAIRVGTFTEAAEIASRCELAAMLPSFTARPYLERRALVRIVPKLTLAPAPLHLVHPQHLRGSPVLATLAAATSQALSDAEARVRAG